MSWNSGSQDTITSRSASSCGGLHHRRRCWRSRLPWVIRTAFGLGRRAAGQLQQRGVVLAGACTGSSGAGRRRASSSAIAAHRDAPLGEHRRPARRTAGRAARAWRRSSRAPARCPRPRPPGRCAPSAGAASSRCRRPARRPARPARSRPAPRPARRPARRGRPARRAAVALQRGGHPAGGRVHLRPGPAHRARGAHRWSSRAASPLPAREQLSRNRDMPPSLRAVEPPVSAALGRLRGGQPVLLGLGRARRPPHAAARPAPAAGGRRWRPRRGRCAAATRAARRAAIRRSSRAASLRAVRCAAAPEVAFDAGPVRPVPGSAERPVAGRRTLGEVLLDPAGQVR